VSGWSPSAQGALIAVAVLVVVALMVFGAIQITRAMWPSGQALTLTKPVGGTLVGAGLNCGTNGSDCSASKADNEPVEFQAVADAGYIFSAFTGDCAPTGRMILSAARTGGATFDRVAETGSGVSWPLTITKPTGGTIVAAGDILCGALGAQCSASLPDGVPVTLHVQAEPGFTFQSYTDDCAPNGETKMSAARTCGAIFIGSAPPQPAPVSAPPSTRKSRPAPLVVEGPPPAAPPAPPSAPPCRGRPSA
jgi:hypothetical protein